jgi:hypothetical protein
MYVLLVYKLLTSDVQIAGVFIDLDSCNKAAVTVMTAISKYVPGNQKIAQAECKLVEGG